MPDNVENVGIRAVVENLDKYIRDLKKMTGATDRTGREMQDTGKKAEGMKKGVVAAGLGFAAAQVAIQSLGTAARFTKRAFIDFEQGIANAGAVANATESEMSAMTDAAMSIGRETRFSAVQATGAFEAMAAAGLPVADILEGGAKAAAALAAAGGVDLPMAADVMSTAMAVWGLETDKAAEAANRLAGAANVSRFQVEDMALAVAQGGGAAAAAGVDFGDFTTAIAAIAPSFSSGSDAGTSFKTFLTRLVPEGEKARAKLAELGLVTQEGGNAFFDAEGNMKSMGEVAGLLQDALGPLTEEQRLSNLQVIFGTDAMRAAAGLMKISRTEFDKMSRTMKETDAAEVAARRMDTLGGRIAFLQSTIETTAIDIGIKLAPALKAIVEGTTAVIATFDALPDSTKNLLLIGGGMTAAALAVTPAVIKIIASIGDLIKWMKAAENAAKLRMAIGIGAAFAAVAVLDLGLQKFTGHGLVATLTGSGAAADRLAAATNKAELEMQHFVETADRVVFAMKRIKQEGDIISENLGKTEGNWLANQAAAMNASVAIEAYAKEVVKTEPHILELLKLHSGLEGETAKVFARVTDLDAKWAAYKATVSGVVPPTDLLQQLQGRLNEKLEEGAADQEALAAAMEDTRPEWLQMIDDIEEAEERTKAYNDAIDTLIGQFASLNPQFIANSTQITFLNEQIGDLETSSFEYRTELEKLESKEGELTAAETARKEELEKILEPLDAQITLLEEQIGVLENTNKAMGDNEKAVEGYRQQIEQLVGPDVFGTLLDDLAQMEDQEAAVDAMGGLANSLALLETEGVEPALAGLEKLKGQLDPEVWELIAADVGPAMIAGLEEGFGPEELADLIERMRAIGVDMGGGMAAGLSASQQAVEIAAQNLGWAGSDAMASVLGIASPSKVGIEMGEAVGEGVAEGIVRSLPEVLRSIDMMGFSMEAHLQPIAGRIVAVSENAMELMSEAFSERSQEIRDRDDLGRMGANMMENLRVALETGSDRAFTRMGTFLANILDEMEEKLDAERAGAIMGRVMAAMNTIITTGGQQGVAELRSILAEIQVLFTQAEKTAEAAADAAKEAAAGVASSVAEAPMVGATFGADFESTPTGRPPHIGPNQVRTLSEGLLGTTFLRNQEVPWTWAGRGQKIPKGGAFADLQPLTPGDVATLQAAIPDFKQGFQKGTPFVPSTGMFMLHFGEMILPARVAAQVRRALSMTQEVGASGAVPPAPSTMGVDLMDVARAMSGPREIASGEHLGAAGGGTSVTVDMRGATLTGTVEENRRMMKEIAEDAIGDQVTRAGFLGGSRR